MEEKSEKGKRREMRKAGLLRTRHANSLEMARAVRAGDLGPDELRSRVLPRTFRRVMGYVRALAREEV